MEDRCLLSLGEEVVSVRLTYSEQDVTLSSWRGFDVAELAGAEWPEDVPGTPWLPAVSTNVLVPAGAELIGAEFLALGEVCLATGLDIYPVQRAVPLSVEETPEFTLPDAAAYGRAELTSLGTAFDEQQMRGLTFVPVRVNPLRVIPATGELFLATEVEVSVHVRLPKAAPLANSRHLDVFEDMLRDTLANPEALGEGGAYRPLSAPAAKQDDESPLAACDYLVITSDALASAFQALADHRAAYNGFNTQVKTVSWIQSQYAGADTQERIRNCIKDYVDNQGTLYVALGGDETVVPDRDCYVVTGSYTVSNMPTDFYYAGLGGTWDENGDGVYGNIVSGVIDGDLSADVLVGRIPVRTADQASAYINKLIGAEITPNTSVTRKFLLSGALTWDTYYGEDRPHEVMYDGLLQYKAAGHANVDDSEMWLRRLYRANVYDGGWDASVVGAHFQTLTTAGPKPTNYTSQFTATLNEGWNFVCHFSHGSNAGVSSFNTTNAAALTGLSTVFWTGACLTGGFDQAEPCFSEAMLRNPTGGVLVYLGCSRYGWGSPDAPPAEAASTGGTSPSYQRAFAKALLTDRTVSMAQAFYDSKFSLVSSAMSNSSSRWVYFGLNYQGDPAIGVRSEENLDPRYPVVADAGDRRRLAPGAALTLDGSGSNAHGYAVSYLWEQVDGPAVTIANADQPVASVASLPGGAYTFKLTVTNLEHVSTSYDLVQIYAGSNPTPVADVISTPEEMPVTIYALANDTDPDPSETLSIVTTSRCLHGVVTNYGDRLVYAPSIDWNGQESFTYTVSDGHGGMATSTVTVSVTPVNDAPVSAADLAFTTIGNSLTICPLANDTDVDGDPLSIQSVTQPAHGTVINTGADVTYIPTAGFNGTDSFTYTAADPSLATSTATVQVTVVQSWPKIVSGSLSSATSNWQTVTLPETFTSMVVIATPQYTSAQLPAVTRIRNASGNSFEIKVQNPSDAELTTGYGVHYLVVEEGVYTLAQHGVRMEARRFQSTVTDENGSWLGQSVGYLQSYTSPVVVGQVMTANDADWSVFWSSNGARANPPSASALYVGKHVGEDPDVPRENETLGFLVIESGSGRMGPLTYRAALGADTIQGIGDGTYTYTITGISQATSVVASQSAMDVTDGGWAVVYGPTGLSDTVLRVAIDEDQTADTERTHSTEQVAYAVFGTVPPDAGPRVVATSPSAASGPVEPTSVIEVSFTEPIDPARLAPQEVGLVNLGNVALAPLATMGIAWNDCVVRGSRLYAATNTGLQIYDVSNPSAPSLLGSYTAPAAAGGLTVAGRYAYLALGTLGIEIVDVSDPANVTRIGAYDTSGTARDVEVVGNRAYVADAAAGLQVLNVSNPAAPLHLNVYNTPGFARAVQVVGSVAYVADESSGLQILNVSSPAAGISRLGYYDTTGSAYGVQVVGNLAYVADYGAGLQILNVANPAAVTRLGGFDTAGSAWAVQVVGSLAYVADAAGGVQILDVSNPAGITALGSFNTAGSAVSLQVTGSVAYVADGTPGGLALQVAEPAATVSAVDGDTCRVVFGRIIPGGTYALQIGPNIFDTSGTPMGQDMDSVAGEAGHDVYSARLTVSEATLDADGSGAADPLSDGILILRYLFDPNGGWNVDDAIGNGVPRATRDQIKSYLDAARSGALDADGNGAADPLTDGILILRYLFEPGGTWCTSDSLGPGATRTACEDIRAYLDQFLPAAAPQVGSPSAPAKLDDALLTQIARAVAAAERAAAAEATTDADKELDGRALIDFLSLAGRA